MYLGDFRVYFKVEVEGWRGTKITEKIGGLCQR